MFSITYHPGVRAMDPRHAGIVRADMETKLAREPKMYGNPLRQTLKNLRTLRVGDYRIVHAIRNRELVVLVLIVGKRDSVYEEALKRLSRMK